MKFTEAKLELAIIELLEQQGYPHFIGDNIDRDPGDVLIKSDLHHFLNQRYADDQITETEINAIIRNLENFSATDLYETNKAIMKMVSDGFLLKREDRSQKDLYIQLIDYSGLVDSRLPKENEVATLVTSNSSTEAIADDSPAYSIDHNIYKMVNQLEIQGYETRIPDGILYINGLPLVVFEFKSAIREGVTDRTRL